MLLHEPIVPKNNFLANEIITNLQNFKKVSDVIVANRMVHELRDVKSKVYFRDLFNPDCYRAIFECAKKFGLQAK